MEIIGRGIQGAVNRKIGNSDAQKRWAVNVLRKQPNEKRRPQPELQKLLRFKGDYFKEFSNLEPWKQLNCNAKMCPDFRRRNEWFKTLQERFNLKNELLPLAPWNDGDRKTAAYVNFYCKRNSAKFTIITAYNEFQTRPLNLYTYILTEQLNNLQNVYTITANSRNEYFTFFPERKILTAAKSFFCAMEFLDSETSECKFFFTMGKVLHENFEMRSFSNVNLNFTFLT